METAVHWITHYGYFGIFALLALGIVGLPVPDETLLMFVGYSIYRGRLQPMSAALSAFLGAACGISLSYALGRGFGRFIIPHWHRFEEVGSEPLKRVQEWFRRAGRWALLFGYYIPGVRHLTAYVAGTSGLRFLGFAVFAYAGAICWTATFLSLGYFFGERTQRVEVLRSLHFLWAILAAAVVVYLLVRMIRFRKTDPGLRCESRIKIKGPSP